ncbi:Zinc finger MYM-type protein 1, partial [Mucuna pruriens]
MERYFIRKSSLEQLSSPQARDECISSTLDPSMENILEFDFEKLLDDPSLRLKFSNYHPIDRDEIRRYYLQKSLCQLKEINFSQRKFGDTFHMFILGWYLKYGGWLEYSQKKDATYCLCCYLLKSHVGEHKGSGGCIYNKSFFANHNEAIHEVLKNAPRNVKLIAPTIQEDVFRVVASETTIAILMSLEIIMEQMVVVLHYVNKKAQVIEHFLSLIHVSNSNTLSLKLALDLSRLHGQGYGEASNMQCEFSGFKSLISIENCLTYYIHYFAHQLQLALITIAKTHVEVALFFNLVVNLSNVVGMSCNHQDILRDISFFSSMIDVLEIVEEYDISLEQKDKACALLNLMQSFEFIFYLTLDEKYFRDYS